MKFKEEYWELNLKKFEGDFFFFEIDYSIDVYTWMTDVIYLKKEI